jgi:hypothetical protein
VMAAAVLLAAAAAGGGAEVAVALLTSSIRPWTNSSAESSMGMQLKELPVCIEQLAPHC